MPDDPMTVQISSQSGIHPEEILRRSFPSSRKGFEPEAVRRFLEAVAAELQAVLDREQALRRRLADAERRAAEPELDEQTLLRLVGAETARILQTAHDAAGEVLSKAKARAAEVLEEAEAVLGDRTATAEQAAAEILGAAEVQAREMTEAAAAEGAARREAATAEAAAVTDAARAEAVALLEATRSECRRVVREARELRSSVLGDLAERRRSMRVQLEQLRSGRDTLLEVVDAVGDAVDHLRERLASAEHEARLAAAEAGDRVLAEAGDEDVLEAAGGEIAVDLPDGPEAPAGVEVGLALAGDEDLAGVHPYDDAEVSGGEEDGETSGHAAHRSVDELFARIRASREQAEQASAAAGVGDPGLGAVDPDEPEPLEPAASTEAADPVSAEAAGDAGRDEEPPGGEPGATPGASPAANGDAGSDEVGDGDAELLSRRAELLDGPAARLARSLKRALQDDQNLLLDSLRHASGRPDLAQLLPPDEQRARLVESTVDLLAEAWRAGYGWLAGKEAREDEAATAARSVAEELVGDLTGMLRHRLLDGLTGIAEVGDGAAEVVGAAYREWRGPRIESTAGDFAARAFCEGALRGGEGVPVRWVVSDEGGPCPDCDDNALAGELVAGEEFPTGQRIPPVHPGCRCLIVAASS
jgi:cell division septum initiation protein DivIVA